ncbi:MAG: hypothetical protein JWO38_704 [Gemmataceae bacterium]|nr:hypothetical protein [Gemmataceae bacterium]
MRTVSGMMLAVAVGLGAGCGGSAPPPAEPTTPLSAAPIDQPPPPKDDPGKSGPATAPPATIVGWEMDPAKHAIPTNPVTGKLAGVAFTPEVEVQGGALRFRTFAGGQATGPGIELQLSEPGKVFENVKLTVRPDQPGGLDVPLVIVNTGGGSTDPRVIDKGGYALTLEVGKRENWKVPGKVYLSLPGDDKTYLAGTFLADWVRTPAELPGPDDVPFVQGKVTVTGATEPNVTIGYLRVEPFDAATPATLDLIGTILKPEGIPVRSELRRPRSTLLVPGAGAKDPGRFEFTKLDPGRYWVFATVMGGPAASKWITVAAGGQVTADFTIDVGVSGGLAVTVPGSAGQVSVLPAAEAGKPWPDLLVPTAASMIGLQADTTTGGKPDPAKKDVTMTFPRLAPGKYEVWAGDLTGSAEVKAGETAKLTLSPKKP